MSDGEDFAADASEVFGDDEAQNTWYAQFKGALT
jgi:hypothetical protein